MHRCSEAAPQEGDASTHTGARPAGALSTSAPALRDPSGIEYSYDHDVTFLYIRRRKEHLPGTGLLFVPNTAEGSKKEIWGGPTDHQSDFGRAFIFSGSLTTYVPLAREFCVAQSLDHPQRPRAKHKMYR